MSLPASAVASNSKPKQGKTIGLHSEQCEDRLKHGHGEVLLDGRLVWRESDSQKNGRQVGLGSLLAAIGASERQAHYIQSVLHPLLAAMVMEAIRAGPSNPAAFCLLWLSSYLGVPNAAIEPIRLWLQQTDATVNAGGALTACTPFSKAAAAAASAAISEQHSDDVTTASRSRAASSAAGRSSCSSRSRTPGDGVHRKVSIADPAAQEGENTIRQEEISATRGNPRNRSVSKERRLAARELPHQRDNETELEPKERKAEQDGMHSVQRAADHVTADTRDEIPASPADLKRHPWTRRKTVGPAQIKLDPIDIYAAISNAPLISEHLSKDDLRALSELVQVRSYEPDSVLMHHGSTKNELFIIHSGRCNRSVPQVAGAYQSGDVFGERSLVQKSYTAQEMVTAASDSHVVALTLNSSDLESLGLLSKLVVENHKESKRARKIRPGCLAIGEPTGANEGQAGADHLELSSPSRRRGWAECGDSGASLSPQRGRQRAAQEATEQRRGTKESVEQRSSSKEQPHVSQNSNGDAPHTISPRGVRGTQAFPGDVDRPAMEKTDSDKQTIREAVQNNRNIMELLQLSEDHLDEIVNRVTRIEIEAGEPVVKKGELGDAFYIIADGVFSALSDPESEKAFKNRDGTVDKKLRIGDSFGELALLYDFPRSSTVISPNKGSVWTLELSQWRTIAKIRSTEKLNAYAELLSGVKLLKDEVGDRVLELAGALEEIYFMSGEQVTKQGDDGDTLYVIFEGSCKVFEDGVEQRSLSRGGFVGIDTLLHGGSYASTCTVISDTAVVLALDVNTLRLVTANADDNVQSNDQAHWRSRRISLQTKNRLMEIHPEKLSFVGVLGVGAFALVSLMHDTDANKLYAVKRMSKNVIVEQGLQEMVVTEKQTLERVNSDFVCHLLGTYKDNDNIHVVMRAALGGELFDLYNREKGWFGSARHASFFSVCIALGLDHMHSKKLVHRDIKLENVLLYSDGYALITDMGIARMVVGKTYTVCGTSDYLAPETLRQVGHNRAVDWWALGVIIFVMMTGQSPFDADDVMQIYRNIVKGFKKEHFPSSMGTNLVDIIKSLCKKKPEDRIVMLPGGIKNLQQHPWLKSNVDWAAVESRSYSPPYKPPKKSIEELRNTLPQDHTMQFTKYEDNGSDWCKAF